MKQNITYCFKFYKSKHLKIKQICCLNTYVLVRRLRSILSS